MISSIEINETMRPSKNTSKCPEPPDSLVERDRIIMQAICDYEYPTMSLNDLGFSGVKWAKAFARVRKRFSIESAPIGQKRYCTPDEKIKEQMRAAISNNATIQVTSRQQKVLLALSNGAMSSDDLAEIVGLPRVPVLGALRKLRKEGLVVQHHIGWKQYTYELTAPYSELEKRIYVSDAHTGPPVSDMEARYYAILRNSKLTGLILSDQYRKMFPHRSHRSILGSVRRAAIKRGWRR